MIEVKNLCQRYGHTLALDGLSFSISDGKVHGLLGPDGAGKSTVMNILSGTLPPTSGTVLIGTADACADSLAVRRTVGYLPQDPPLYGDMTPFEYLVFVGEAKKISQEKLFRQIKSALELTGLEEYSERLIRNLSRGQRQRVGIAMTLLGNPAVILLDEPTSGLDVAQAKELRELIRKLGQVKTVIVSSSRLSEIRSLCDDMLLLSHGQLIARDTLEGLETRLANTPVLKLTVRGSEQSILDTLSRLEELTDCTVLPAEEAGTVSLKLEYRTDAQLRDKVSALLSESGYPILSMEQTCLTLEEVYLKLSDDSAKEAASEEATEKPKKKSRHNRKNNNNRKGERQ